MTEKIDAYGRRRSRALIVQGLYELFLTGNSASAIAAHLAEMPTYSRSDMPYFEAAWAGVTKESDALKKAIAPHLDRAADAVSPVEMAVLTLSAWELTCRVDVPCRVILDEAVTLAKTYGGADGHKFVNGVLDKLAAKVRADEVNAGRSRFI